MGWFKSLFAAIGIIWDVIKCVACAEQVLVRKGDLAPPGWVTKGAQWICPNCAAKQDADVDKCVKDNACWDDV